ncbi:MAG: hypothetical protein JW869_01285 [Candidatus Omnitrophica bacterium]|nr:hypothetical protein [Candidatus Omnitrophota bacterium]
MNGKKGIAYLIVTSMILMMLVLSAAIVRLASGHFTSTAFQMQRERAYYAAEAAMNYALTKCRLGASGGYDLPNLTYPFIDSSLTIQDPNYQLNTKIVILQAGTSAAVGPGENYTCPAGLSPYCIYCRVEY